MIMAFSGQADAVCGVHMNLSNLFLVKKRTKKTMM